MKGIEFLLLAVGGIAGTLARYAMTSSPLVLFTLPVNILLVNVVGSFVLGAFAVFLTVLHLDPRLALLVAIGFCGSLTTMSSFALETSSMLDNKQFANVAVNIAANVGLSIGSIYAGRTIATLVLSQSG